MTGTLEIKQVWRVRCTKCDYTYYTDTPPDKNICQVCEPGEYVNYYSYLKNRTWSRR